MKEGQYQRGKGETVTVSQARGVSDCKGSGQVGHTKKKDVHFGS